MLQVTAEEGRVGGRRRRRGLQHLLALLQEPEKILVRIGHGADEGWISIDSKAFYKR